MGGHLSAHGNSLWETCLSGIAHGLDPNAPSTCGRCPPVIEGRSCTRMKSNDQRCSTYARSYATFLHTKTVAWELLCNMPIADLHEFLRKQTHKNISCYLFPFCLQLFESNPFVRILLVWALIFMVHLAHISGWSVQSRVTTLFPPSPRTMKQR